MTDDIALLMEFIDTSEKFIVDTPEEETFGKSGFSKSEPVPTSVRLHPRVIEVKTDVPRPKFKRNPLDSYSFLTLPTLDDLSSSGPGRPYSKRPDFCWLEKILVVVGSFAHPNLWVKSKTVDVIFQGYSSTDARKEVNDFFGASGRPINGRYIRLIPASFMFEMPGYHPRITISVPPGRTLVTVPISMPEGIPIVSEVSWNLSSVLRSPMPTYRIVDILKNGLRFGETQNFGSYFLIRLDEKSRDEILLFGSEVDIRDLRKTKDFVLRHYGLKRWEEIMSCLWWGDLLDVLCSISGETASFRRDLVDRNGISVPVTEYLEIRNREQRVFFGDQRMTATDAAEILRVKSSFGLPLDPELERRYVGSSSSTGGGISSNVLREDGETIRSYSEEFARPA